jgi:GTPase SAR1 family protein
MASAPPITKALPDVEGDPNTLRIVLFGMPDAGKSSLLGALVQAAHTQDRVLQGRLLDLTNGMAELWRRVYEDRQRETLEEIVPYSTYFEPYAGDPDATPNVGVMLYDCDGRIANELLSQRQSLQKNVKAGTLAQAVLDADALILTIDASASDEQVETDFREFVRFLRVLESHRSRKHSVGGLPVYLVLSKCDRLVREPISKVEWEKRILARQTQVKERFARYLEGNAGPSGSLLTFGSLDLRVFHTAVKHPALTDAPAQPRSPFGVAELFHDCVRAAYEFRQRSRQADRRLHWLIAGAAGFLATAIASAFFLIQSGGPVEKPLGLVGKVAQFEEKDKPLPDRLAGDALQRRSDELAQIRGDPDFDKLPDAPKNFVLNRQDELQAYVRLREQLARMPPPENARTLAELDRIKEKLETQAPLPSKYQQDWEKAPPPAVAERARRLRDAQTIRDAVDELKTFFAALKNKANDRLFDTEFHSRWDDQVTALLENESNPPVGVAEGIRGNAYAFDDVTALQKEWLAAKKRLQDVRDMAIAVGLLRDRSGQSASLLISAIPADANLNSYCAARLESLKRLYPNYKNWSLASVPDALQNEIRKKLKKSYDQLLRDSQRMIFDQFRHDKPTGDDAPRDWRTIADWIVTPALKDWHELLATIAKMLDPLSADPVAEAAVFLKKDSFDIQLRALTVNIPKDLPQGLLTPAETMQVYLKPQGPNTIRSTLVFRIDKSATIDGAREKKFRFVLEEGDGKLLFKPGDDFGAELALSKGTKNWEFVWSNASTASYAFDALIREPNLRPAGATERGSLADGVSMIVDGRFPTVPALLPVVRRERK